MIAGKAGEPTYYWSLRVLKRRYPAQHHGDIPSSVTEDLNEGGFMPLSEIEEYMCTMAVISENTQISVGFLLRAISRGSRSLLNLFGETQHWITSVAF